MEIVSFTSILKEIFNHLEGIMGFASVLIALKVYSESKRDKKEAGHEKRIEIYMELYHDWDEIWGKITQSPEQNKDLFKKSFKDIQDENLRFYIMNAISLLSRVFYYYSETRQEIEKSEWHETVKHVFEKRVFITAFHKNEYRFSKKFREYVSKVKMENKESNILDVSLKDKELNRVINKVRENGQ